MSGQALRSALAVLGFGVVLVCWYVGALTMSGLCGDNRVRLITHLERHWKNEENTGRVDAARAHVNEEYQAIGAAGRFHAAIGVASVVIFGLLVWRRRLGLAWFVSIVLLLVSICLKACAEFLFIEELLSYLL